jgi:hypothetical protein
MTVTAVRKDPQTLTLTLEAEFNASPERVWQLWADPRQLERWWGPADIPCHLHQARPRPWRPRRVPHDRARRRTAARLLGGPGGGRAASTHLARRMRERRQRAEYRHAAEHAACLDRGRRRRTHARVDRDCVPERRGRGAGPGHGHEEGLRRAVGQIDAILAEQPIQR